MMDMAKEAYRIRSPRFALTRILAGVDNSELSDRINQTGGASCWSNRRFPTSSRKSRGTPSTHRSDWLTLEVGLDASFLVKLLETDEPTLKNWRLFNADLPPGREDTLRRFWQMTLHLLSFLNFDLERVRELFQHAIPARSKDQESALARPWSGMTLKEYFERLGGLAVEKVDCWVTGLRFSDPHAV